MVEQERRPNKRVFKLAEAGVRELHGYTGRPAKPAALRDDLVVKLQAVDVGDAAAVRASVAEWLEHACAKLARYERLREHLLVGRPEEEFLREADRVGPYLALMGGRMYERETIRWCDRVLAVLDARARS